MKKRIAFIFRDTLLGWNGGINYYKNLVDILQESQCYEPVIFASPKLQVLIQKKNPKAEVHYYDYLTDGTFSTNLRKFVLYLFKYNLFINSALKKNNIDFVSHNEEFPMNKNTKCKSLSWIPDFQSYHYPELFSKKSMDRDLLVRKLLIGNSNGVIVSSYDAKKDLMKYFPKTDESKVKVFQFGLPPIPENSFDDSVLDKYDVSPYSYFLITNQFWAHKNHIVVLKALVEISKKQLNIPFTILVTGLQNDPRGSENFAMLKDFIEKNNLSLYFRMTGNIPYSDVKLLQHFSMAVIQPSLFEGWNTAVEECKLLGKKIILSNIPVHLEQNPENVIFFDPHDEDKLADILLGVYGNYDRKKEEIIEKNSEHKQMELWQKFSNKYIALIDEALAE